MSRLLLSVLLVLMLAGPVQAGNALTQNPIIVDTPAATSLISGYIEVVCIRWHGVGTASDNAIVQDKNGLVRWQANGSTSTLQDEQTCWPADAPLRMDGLLVPTLSSGTLLIYIKKPMPPS